MGALPVLRVVAQNYPIPGGGGGGGGGGGVWGLGGVSTLSLAFLPGWPRGHSVGRAE